ncbi:bacillithiol biosynthesis cysteine-adding enzyme BshC [Rubrolithibacter danxiaensis]|uniref:bacillithiol biosynthesis cysteine-adding enzyme BshC n=1 Tax=Rubrolithibacter danxiaensis TaxID=3390805 RepID=UPI003BF7E43A
MKSSCIDYKDTGYFSPAVIQYLQQSPQLFPFIAYQPTFEGLKQAIENRVFKGDRKVLVEVLQDQYKELDKTSKLSEAVNQNLSLLLKDSTYTITTGHQLNIFTGPLYFIFKIVTAINLAKELKEKFPDKDFVPVYWMATEDHDFAEINHTSVQGQKLSWDAEVSGATGRLSTETISATVKAYQQLLGISENATRLSKLAEEAYLQHKNLADATRYFVNTLFSEFGLIILDADNKQLKQLFAPFIEKDITENNSYRLISDTSNELENAGFKTQVNAREINFFYLLDNFRERIVREGEKYYVLNSEIEFSKEELSKEIRQHPERFSPNVIMRPLYQELILPNLAYVGGGAEIVYWLQLKKNFDFYGIDFPVLVLRNSALIATDKLQDKLNRLDLTLADIFKDPESVKKEWVLKNSTQTLTLDEEWQELKDVLEKAKLKATKIDSTLGPSTEAVAVRLHKAISNLEKKLIKAEKRNYDGSLSLIDNLRKKYFAGNSLQERTENFSSFYVKYGDTLIDELAQYFKPLDFKFTILEPK